MDLIVTCARNMEYDCKDEIESILKKMGDFEPEIKITKMQGILTVKTSIDNLEFIEFVRNMIKEEPWEIRYILRAIPIQNTTITDIEEIDKTVAKIIPLLPEGKTYRISIEKRNSNISGEEIIKKIASKITNKVSLEEPDWVIQIEILGGIAGVSLIKREQILSVPKTKRDSE